MSQRGDVEPSYRIPFSQDFLNSIRFVEDALKWHDEVFLELAYRIMLRRGLDREGRRYYLSRLRGGRSRIAILDQLGKSSEADPLFVQVSDLQSTLLRYRASRRPLAGLWSRWRDPEFGTRASFVQARAISNALGRTRQDVALACEDLLAAQQDLIQTLARQGPVVSPAAQSMPNVSVARTPRARSVFDVREIDFNAAEKRVIDALRI